MPVSSAVRTRCRPFLAPGEEIRYAFPAAGLTLGMVSFIVMVTQAHVTVLSCSWFRPSRPDGIWAQYDRSTRLGPVEMCPAPTVKLGSLMLEIDEEYVSVVNAADAEISAPDNLPRDPLPDL